MEVQTTPVERLVPRVHPNVSPSKVLVDKIVADIANRGPNNLTAFAAIMDLTNIYERSKIYPLMRRAAKILMKDHGLFLQNERDIGYWSVKRGKEIRVCQQHHERGVKAIKRSVTMANWINLDKLSPTSRTETVAIQQRMSNNLGMLRASED